MRRASPFRYYSGAADVAATQPVREDLDGPYKAYNINLKARGRRARGCVAARVTHARRFKTCQAPIFTAVGANPRAEVHLQEWAKVLAGDPIEIRLEDGADRQTRIAWARPSHLPPRPGYGYKVMTIDEWTLKWKARFGGRG